MTTYGDISSDSILKTALADLEQTNEDYEGIGHLVCILYAGAVEDEITVSGEDASRSDLIPLLQDALDNDISADSETEVWISEVYIGPDVIEATGYETDVVLTREDEDEEPTEPSEDDLTTTDHAHFWQYGKCVLTVDNDASTDEMWEVIQAWMESEGFYPNVWFISDHGNAHLLTH